jgi:putative phosphoesterase
MKVVIVSDSHGSFGVLQKIVARETPFDLLIHLGDGIEEVLRLKLLKDFNLDAVAGNNDPKDYFPDQLTLKLGPYRCFMTHGQLYEVNDNLDQLVEAAKREKATIAFYGHTHQYNDQLYKGIRLINPGTICSYLNCRPTYLTIEIHNRELIITKVELKNID